MTDVNTDESEPDTNSDQETLIEARTCLLPQSVVDEVLEQEGWDDGPGHALGARVAASLRRHAQDH